MLSLPRPGHFRRPDGTSVAAVTSPPLRRPAPAGYSGTPLPSKLGIKPGCRLLVADAPADLVLEPLPDGVDVERLTERLPSRSSGARFDVVMLFCADMATLEARFVPLMELLEPASALWVCWPKRASGVLTDLGEKAVREHGLFAGMVDVKVCAVDAVWSGLKFVYRVSDRPNASSTQA